MFRWRQTGPTEAHGDTAEARLVFGSLLLFGLMVAIAGCGGSELKPTARDLRDANDLGRTIEPGNPSERAVLAELDGLPAETPRKLQGVVVVAGAPYHSASGRTCRSLRVKRGNEMQPARVACTEGDGWFYVPNVFEPTPAPQ